MDKLQRQSTAYLLSKQLPSEVVREIHEHKYVSMLDLVKTLVDQELESWQYCYVHTYKPNDKRIPEYIVESISQEKVEEKAQMLAERDSPVLAEDTPIDRDRQVVEAAGGREEYSKVQIDLYTQVCARSLGNTIYPLLQSNLYSSEEVDPDTVIDISEEFLDAVGLWTWYLFTQKTDGDTIEEGSYEGDTVSKWALRENTVEIINILQNYYDESELDYDGLETHIKNFESYFSS